MAWSSLLTSCLLCSFVVCMWNFATDLANTSPSEEPTEEFWAPGSGLVNVWEHAVRGEPAWGACAAAAVCEGNLITTAPKAAGSCRWAHCRHILEALPGLFRDLAPLSGCRFFLWCSVSSRPNRKTHEWACPRISTRLFFSIYFCSSLFAFLSHSGALCLQLCAPPCAPLHLDLPTSLKEASALQTNDNLKWFFPSTTDLQSFLFEYLFDVIC